MSDTTTKPKQDKLKTLLAYSGVVLRSSTHLSNGSLDSFIFEAENYCAGQDRDNLSLLRIRSAITMAKAELKERRNLTI